MRRFLCASAALLLGGCASFSGVPEPVFSTADALGMVRDVSPPVAMRHMSTLTEPARTNYRNLVVTSYLVALDARYDDFRRDISKNSKGGNLAFDLATLGLAGLASTWASAADELASGATMLAGGRASLNRELYFEKALPSLLSLMESKRQGVRSDILRGLSQSEQLYTLHDAFADLWRYQSAASIDGAIQQAAAAAAEEAKASNLDYEKAVQLCRVDDEIAKGRKDVMIAVQSVRDAANKEDEGRTHAQATLQKVAQTMGESDVALPANAEQAQAVVSSLRDILWQVCSQEELAGVRAKVEAAGVKFQ